MGNISSKLKIRVNILQTLLFINHGTYKSEAMPIGFNQLLWLTHLKTKT